MTLSPLLRTTGLSLIAATFCGFAAHAAAPTLVSANPGPKDGYGAWPKQIHLRFDQPLAQDGLKVDLLDPDGRRIPLGAPARSAQELTIGTHLTDPPVPGPYMLSWQARSMAGDEAKGEYTFFVQ
jgi:copper transport protein